MGRNQVSSQDDFRREPFPRRGHRGRGRSRGRYSKDGEHSLRSQRNFRNSHTEIQDYKRSRNPEGNQFLHDRSSQNDSIEDSRIEDRINKNDPYDQQTSESGITEGKLPEERISLPNENQIEIYDDSNIDEHSEENKSVSREHGPNLAGYSNEGGILDYNILEESRLPKNIADASIASSIKDGNFLKDAHEVSSKDPEELRQKVLDSLAEKKKKAAVFMNMEKDGAINADILNDNQTVATSSGSNDSGNPERDAAVDALLATFGGPLEAKPGTTPEYYANEDVDEVYRQKIDLDVNSRGHDQVSLSSCNGQDKIDDGYTPGSIPGERNNRSRGSGSQEINTKGEHDRYQDTSLSSRSYLPTPTRSDIRREYRHSSGYEKESKSNPRQDSRYRFDRYETPSYLPKDTKYRESTINNQNDLRYSKPENEQRPLGRDEHYHNSEVVRGGHPRDSYDKAKQAQYPDAGLHDVEYNAVAHDFPSYPTQGRYITPLSDPRYPPSTNRGPDTEYATAVYYTDLTEWLEVTGYHDYSYRQMVLKRRDMHSLEESRRYALPEEPGYMTRSQQLLPRDDSGVRRARGASLYSMPPPPLPNNAHWEDQDHVKGSITSPRISRPRSRSSAYPPLPASNQESDYHREELQLPTNDKSGLKRRLSSGDCEYNEPRLSKSVRQAYDSAHRSTSPHTDNRPRTGYRNLSRDKIDETEAVRQSLSRRIAASRGFETSPNPPSERVRQRSLSVSRIEGNGRDFSGMSKDHTSSDAYKYHHKEYRGRSYSRRGPSREGFRNSFRGQRGSFGDQPTSPFDRKNYGRGRGRGYSKELLYERDQRYDNRDNFVNVMESEPNSGITGEARNSKTRYFMIKSFNDDNVKMAQQDNIWATQQKNAEIFEQAFKEARDVILFFSINKSGKFQGYARMEGAPGSAPIPSWAKNLLWESSGPFRIRWISITDISFHRVAHLKNTLNEGQPVLIGRDGQEIDPDCGYALCRTIDETVAFRKIHGPSED